MKIGAIEGGGTKFVCALCDEKGNIFERAQFQTTTPEETMAKVIEFFKDKDIERFGVGCFGPIDLNKSSKTYGYITTTPKIPWKFYDIVGEIKKYFNVPIAFDTDVNGAALGEVVFGHNAVNSCVYMTIGTGIGAGAVIDGNLVHGLLHPEMGHSKVTKRKDDQLECVCPYHNDCLEGLAAGPALEKRYGIRGETIGPDHEAWDLEAYYIAQGLVNITMILSPEKIALGGGVSKQKQIYPLIHKYFKEGINGYVDVEKLNNLEDYICYTSLGDDAGIKGAVALALKL
ncbi:MAG: ROK family protein [Lachnospirales bacterium]